MLLRILIKNSNKYTITVLSSFICKIIFLVLFFEIVSRGAMHVINKCQNHIKRFAKVDWFKQLHLSNSKPTFQYDEYIFYEFEFMKLLNRLVIS